MLKWFKKKKDKKPEDEKDLNVSGEASVEVVSPDVAPVEVAPDVSIQLEETEEQVAPEPKIKEPEEKPKEEPKPEVKKLAKKVADKPKAKTEEKPQEKVSVVQKKVAPQPAQPEPEKKSSWLGRLTSGLKKSSTQLTDGIKAVITKRKLDQQMLDDLEDALIMADIGVGPARRFVEALSKDRFDKEVSDEDVREFLANQIADTLRPVAQPLELNDDGLQIILMVGVNGTGKTTTIGKLAQQYKALGKSVMLAAGDTFRAAAIEQLQVWGERSGVPVIAKTQGTDAAALVFDAVAQAKAQNVDVLLVDTAGRLHNKDDLMQELAKVVRVMQKQDATAPHYCLLTLDATTGQNAFQQVRAFQDMVNVTGLVVTKLDGTAKGGVVVGLADQFGLPIHAIGVGESIDDLKPFTAEDFAKGLLGV